MNTLKKLTSSPFLFGIAAMFMIAFGFVQNSYSQSVTYNYTGAVQTYTVPLGVSWVSLTLTGAAGGNAYGGYTVYGGLGSTSTSILSVTPGDVLNIYVGGHGVDSNITALGGYNGGGNGNVGTGSGGGGATDVRIGGTALADRIAIAGGGGGANSAGGYGGGGGNNGPFNGVLGNGSNTVLGGGGGGLYGGAQGTFNGRGGQSYINASAGFQLITEGTDRLSSTEVDGSAIVAIQTSPKLTLTTAGSIIGNTVLSAGELDLNSVGGPIMTGDSMYLTANGTGVIKLLQNNQVISNATLWIADSGNFDLNGHSQTFGGVNLQGGSISDSSGGGILTCTTTYNLENGTVSAILAGNVGMNKTTGATVILSGANTYSGTTALSAGTLNLSNSLALQNSTLNMAGGSLVFDQSVASHAFSIGGLSASSSGAGYDIALIDNGGHAIALTVGANNASTTYAGILSGTGSLIKTGTGTLILSGANNYSGGTTINAGKLNLSNSLALQNSTLNMAGGSLVFDQSVASHAFSIGGLSAVSSGVGYDIALTDNGGHAVALTVGANNASTTYAGILSGTGSLIKTGTGTLILSGANNYSGGTTINAGTLQAGGSKLGTGAVTLNGGTLTPSSSLNISSLIWNGGSISLSLGTTTFVVGTSGNLTLGAGGGTFSFSAGAGFSGDTLYEVLTAANLADPMMSLFSANALTIAGNSTNGIFSRIGNSVYVNYATSSSNQTFSGPTTISGNGNTTINRVYFRDGTVLTINSGGRLVISSGHIELEEGTCYFYGSPVNSPNDMHIEGHGTYRGNSDIEAGGNIFIEGGTCFAMDGNIYARGGLLSVLLNAILGGLCDIYGNVSIGRGGVIAPGHSPGTINVHGNYVQQDGSMFQLQVQSSSIYDQLYVTGSASLAGNLQVQSWAGHQFAFGDAIPFLHAGSIHGSFSSIQMENPSVFRGRFLVEGGTGILLVAPTSYTQVATNQNERNISKSLDRFINAVGNDREIVSTALDWLTADQYPAAFQRIMPIMEQVVAENAINGAFNETQMLNQRMSSVRLGVDGFQTYGLAANPIQSDSSGGTDGKKSVIQFGPDTHWSAWVMGNGQFSQQTNISDLPTGKNDGGGFLAGGDYKFGEGLSAGLFAGYQGSYSTYGNSGDICSNGILFGGYGSLKMGGFFLDGIIGGGTYTDQVHRNIRFSSIDRTASSQQSVGQFNSSINLGYDFKAGNFVLTPLAGIQYTYAGVGGYQESGADALDLSVRQQNENSLRSTLGGRIAYNIQAGKNLLLIPEVRMFWQHEFCDGSRAITSTLDGGHGSSFDYWTDSPSANSVFAGLGLTTQIGKRINASVFYNAGFGDQNNVNNIISGSFGFSF